MPTPFPAASHRLSYETVTPDDFPELLDLYNSNPDYMECAYGKRVVTLDTVQRDDEDNRKFAGSYNLCIRHARTRRLIGIAQFILQNPRDGHPWLGLIMLHANSQGKGYAKEFLDTLIAWYQENGYSSLHLAVLEKNRKVVPFYEKYGFRFYEERMTEEYGRVLCMVYPRIKCHDGT